MRRQALLMQARGLSHDTRVLDHRDNARHILDLHGRSERFHDHSGVGFRFRRRGEALHSVISEGCIVSGGTVRNSVLGRSVFVHSWSQVEDSVVMDYSEIGRHARVRRAIIDKNVYVTEGDEIGYDLERDRQRFHVTDSGLVVIAKAPKRERQSL